VGEEAGGKDGEEGDGGAEEAAPSRAARLVIARTSFTSWLPRRSRICAVSAAAGFTAASLPLESPASVEGGAGAAAPVIRAELSMRKSE
jgi:hypothetical protein